MADFNITAESTPVYDGFGFADYWSCTDWTYWHSLLKAKFGKVQADQTWLQAWNKQDAFESNYNWCKYSSSFNSYVNSENLPVTHLLSDVISGGTKVGENLIGTAVQTSKVPLNVASILKWLIPTLLIIGVIGALIYFAKRYNIFSSLKA